MTTSLDVASRELLERLDTEDARPPETAGTHLVGGLTKIGAKLEALLRATVLELAEAEGVAVESLLPMLSGKKVALRQATGGQLVRALDQLELRRGTMSAAARTIVDDLRRRPSAIRTLVRVRNEAAHGDGVPKNASSAVRGLRRLLVQCRRAGGWE